MPISKSLPLSHLQLEDPQRPHALYQTWSMLVYHTKGILTILGNGCLLR